MASEQEIIELIEQIGIVPVVVLEDEKDAEPLADALKEGGLPCAEVTFRTEAAESAIRLMLKKYPDMVVRAGTVLTVAQAERAVRAGARFIVSPGYGEEVVNYCIKNNIVVIPGVSSASDIQRAIGAGLKVVKFFPAEASGGLDMIKALAAPYKNIKFMPTGGINVNNLESYLAFPKIIACGGSWMVKSTYIKDGKFSAIKEMTENAVQKMLGLHLKKIVFSQKKEEVFKELSSLTERDFDFCENSAETSFIEIETNSVMRTARILKDKGILFHTETRQDISNENVIILDQKADGISVIIKNRSI